MKSRGGYFDGRSSLRRDVSVTLSGDFLLVSGEGIDLRFPVREARTTSPVGSVRRAVRFPDGGICEVEDSALLEAIDLLTGKGKAVGELHRWEKSLTRAVIALLVTAAVVWGFMKFGIPRLATRAAFAIPPETEAILGRQSLSFLDKVVFVPSTLPPDRKQTLATRFAGAARTFPQVKTPRLEFRGGGAIGANALALPSGVVVITDELVMLARNDDEVVAVLAHELGHVERRHIMRHILQSSAAGLLMATLTGDILSATSLSATLPTALVEAKFSRDFEREADDAAARFLLAQHIPLRRFTDLLERLQADHERKMRRARQDGEKVTDYLSSHPPTQERVQRFLSHGGKSAR